MSLLTKPMQPTRAKFESGAQQCGIPIEKLSVAEALRREPNLNPRVLAVYAVPDGSFDPLRLALSFAASAKQNGAKFLPYHQVEDLLTDGTGTVTGAQVWDRTADKKLRFSWGYRNQRDWRMGGTNHQNGESTRFGDSNPGSDGSL